MPTQCCACEKWLETDYEINDLGGRCFICTLAERRLGASIHCDRITALSDALKKAQAICAAALDYDIARPPHQAGGG